MHACGIVGGTKLQLEGLIDFTLVACSTHVHSACMHNDNSKTMPLLMYTVHCTSRHSTISERQLPYNFVEKP